MRYFPVQIVVGLAVLTAGCTKSLDIRETDPFIIPRAILRSKVKVVALADVTVPDGMQDPTPVIEQFDSLIEARLRQAGFSVVRPQSYENVWAGIVRELEGLTDPETGERDRGRVTEAMFRTISRLKAGFGLDAVLVPGVIVVEAPFASGRAYWDGTTQSIKTGNIVRGFLAGSPEGRLGALSLRVTLHGEGGEAMYDAAGGIEVLSKLDGREFVLVPRQELLTDPKKLRHAVAVALDPLSN